jgi:hypothetical protein
MNCPKCKTNMYGDIEMTGGCFGHHGEDSRCYCDSPDCHIIFVCPNHQKQNLINNRYQKNPNYCPQNDVSPSDLSCRDSIARWFQEHYQPTENTVLLEK